MNQIGERIRELRKLSGLSQEKLANSLGISCQAVSKWETGAASPDLAMLVPLARLFHVSTDQLLGYSGRREELENIWQQTLRCNDHSKTLEIAEAAIKEYPHDLTFLYRRACDEFFLGDKEASDEEFKREYFERSVRHFKELISEHPDFDSAAGMLVQVLSKLGRNEEALSYAVRHKDKDILLKYCLTGEELDKHRRSLICAALEKLLVALTQYKKPDSFKTAVKILNIMRSEGDYLKDYKSAVFDGIQQWLLSSN